MNDSFKQITSILSKADKQSLAETQRQLAEITDLTQLYEALVEYGGADLRTGAETYGYRTEEQVKSDMIYISDRWQASFRIKWLIDFINLPQEELERLTKQHD